MATKGRIVKEPVKLLWIGDAVAHTGFSSVTHGILNNLYKKFDVHVLGVNYFGDPHDYPYKIYPAAIGGDVFGIGRLPSLMRGIKPHIICAVNDPWVIKDYIPGMNTPIGKNESGADIFAHTTAYMPVDGKNLNPDYVLPLNELDLAIAYTEFARNELKTAGLTSKTDVIPHGVDL